MNSHPLPLWFFPNPKNISNQFWREKKYDSPCQFNSSHQKSPPFRRGPQKESWTGFLVLISILHCMGIVLRKKDRYFFHLKLTRKKRDRSRKEIKQRRKLWKTFLQSPSHDHHTEPEDRQFHFQLMHLKTPPYETLAPPEISCYLLRNTNRWKFALLSRRRRKKKKGDDADQMRSSCTQSFKIRGMCRWGTLKNV